MYNIYLVCTVAFNFLCLYLCKRGHIETAKVQDNEKQQEEMKSLNDDELKKNTKIGGKSASKVGSRKSKWKQVCKRITFQQSSVEFCK